MENSKVTITKELKARLLLTIASGIFDAEKYPEFKQAYRGNFKGFSFLPYTPEVDDPDNANTHGNESI